MNTTTGDRKTISLIKHALELEVQIETPNCRLRMTIWVGPFNDREALDEWRGKFHAWKKRDREARRDFMIEIGEREGADDASWYDLAKVRRSLAQQINLAQFKDHEEIMIEPTDPEDFARYLFSVVVEFATHELQMYSMMARGDEEKGG